MKGQQEGQPAGALVEQALSHPDRVEMLGRIEQRNTGIEEVELADALGMTRAKAKYHLAVLRNAELVAPADRESDLYVLAGSGA